MSLFGDQPAKSKSSLFEDEPSSTAPRGSGLFADDAPAEGSDSPWNFVSPKKRGRSNLVKTLLPSSAVPEAYIDAWDFLIDSGDVTGAGVTASGVQRLLDSSALSQEDQSRILNIVTPEGEQSIGRGEFNVLLALIGLAQEGEDATLDGVDDRKKSLPIPSLPVIQQTKATTAAASAQQQPPPHPQPLAREHAPSTAKSKAVPVSARSQASQKQAFSFPDSDPWASPAAARDTMSSDGPASFANGSSYTPHPPDPVRTTSNFTTSEADTSTRPPDDVTSGGAGDAWTSYGSAMNDDFGAPGAGESALPQLKSSARTQRHVSHGAEEILMVTTLADKEGMFLFQHRNYEISSARKNTKVIRRYSDFVWLLDCLYKKYPFRQLPLLPPKRVAINGNHIAADNTFIEKRRKGLARFVNAIIRHPVLREEQLVTMFLTVPTELAAWRKQASISVVEEFTSKPLPPTLEDSLPPSLEDLFTTVRGGVGRSAEMYISMCSIVERLIKRRDGLSAEYLRLSQTFGGLTEVSADTYSMDTNDVPMLNEGLSASAKYSGQHAGMLDQESRQWDEGVLEELKMQRDTLVAMRDMFDRKDRLARDSIPQLERRIQSNENKLAGVRNKPEVARKAGEAEKLEEAIMKDKEGIVAQHARGVFIKDCVREEISFFQSNQFHVSRTCTDWAQERVRHSESRTENWRTWAEQVESMPLGE